jgi:peptidyl-prolyl cis-trans isomerase B (cyclophilin B)
MATDKQRREAARRRLERQLRRRAEREQRRKRATLIASILGTLIVVAIVLVFVVATGNDSKKPEPAAAHTTPAAPTTTASTSAAPPYPCTWTPDGTAARKVSVPATTTPPKTGTVTVSVATTRGPMRFTLNRALAPCTVASFVSLVQQHYYDHTPCHRLTTTGIYVLQCGDPTGQGTGGPGYSIPDEATGNETYPAGTIAMARTQQAHSGGSQFFIVYRDSPNLVQHLGALQYTVFGKVTRGLSVVTEVAAKGASPAGDGKPKLPITLTTLAVAR